MIEEHKPTDYSEFDYICPIMSRGNNIVYCVMERCMAWIPERENSNYNNSKYACQKIYPTIEVEQL